MDTVICVYCKYRLRSAWLIVLIRLAIPPCCMLLISASSSADCETLASVDLLVLPYSGRNLLPSRSLKLLPILGVSSLALFPDAVDRRGLTPAISAARRGLSPAGSLLFRRCSSLSATLTGTPELAELADDSVADFLGSGCCSLWRRRGPPGCWSRRSVALRSCREPSRGCSDSRESGRKAGESSSSSSSSLRPGRCVENLPNRLNLGVFLSAVSSSASDSSDELDIASSSSSRVGDL